jgi:hypothetical protein
MNRILIVAISALMLAGCAGAKTDTYNKSVMPTATAGLQQETVGCKAKWTAKTFRNYSEWQACQLTAERGFLTTISLTKMDAFEVYAADMRALAADRDAKRVTGSQVISRTEEIRSKFFADCDCRQPGWRRLNRSPAWNYAGGGFGPPSSAFSMGPSGGRAPEQHTPLP